MEANSPQTPLIDGNSSIHSDEFPFTADQLATCIDVLQAISVDPTMMNQHNRFKSLVAKIHRQGKLAKKKVARSKVAAADRAAIEGTEIVRQQTESLVRIGVSTSNTLQRSRSCYVCKDPYFELHHFYHQLCPKCAEYNWGKRDQRADLTGRTALITGGRIKIGYQTALKLLRDGATVIVTTRFSQDAAKRFASEHDFDEWRDRLQIHALDLRNIPSVELFAQRLNRELSSLDIVVHNAAQTVKRPLEFYQHLLDAQNDTAAAELICGDTSQPVLMESWSKYRGHLPAVGDYFPPQCFDRDGQQVDMRPEHSWLLKIGEVETVEMLEVFLVNAAAPFTLTSRLKPLLLKAPSQRRFVINVSAMEGQFGRKSKTAFHPHTNMAKAALNMLTRTSADDLAKQGIFMNSVDTGWITDEKPVPLAEKVREEHGFYPPLDIIDGAARVYDPIAVGLNEAATPLFGHFLKDYFPYPW